MTRSKLVHLARTPHFEFVFQQNASLLEIEDIIPDTSRYQQEGLFRLTYLLTTPHGTFSNSTIIHENNNIRQNLPNLALSPSLFHHPNK
jgi:hypothetical protein